MEPHCVLRMVEQLSGGGGGGGGELEAEKTSAIALGESRDDPKVCRGCSVKSLGRPYYVQKQKDSIFHLS